MKWLNRVTLMTVVTAGGLFFLSGTVATLYAEDEKPELLDKAQLAKSHEAQERHGKGQDREQQQAQDRDDQQAYPPLLRRRHVHQDANWSIWQQRRARSWQAEHRTWQQRGGYNGYRISDDRFHGYFGQDHGFRIYPLSLEVYGGNPRFQYGGYWFSLNDPWPEYWSDRWYENDEVYIDYSNDGYYLYNRRHPGVGVAISVEMK